MKKKNDKKGIENEERILRELDVKERKN